MRKSIFIFLVIALLGAVLFPSGQAQAGKQQAARALSFYVFDRVQRPGDFATIAGWSGPGVTAITRLSFIGAPTASDIAAWKALLDAAKAAGVKVVVWPSDWSDPKVRANCNHESPYPVAADGDISRIKPMLDVLLGYDNVIGIVTAHEPQWNCSMPVREMAGLKAQINAYTNGKVKVWAYLGNITESQSLKYFPDSSLSQIMDVLVQWKHCAGRAESVPCESVPGRAQADRARLDKLGLDIPSVFLLQTFVSDSPYNTRLTASELKTLALNVAATGAVDGVGWYTFDADWWKDLRDWAIDNNETAMVDTVKVVYQQAYNGVTLPTSTPRPPTATALPVTSAPTVTPGGAVIRFASMGDGQGEAARVAQTVAQIKSLGVDFAIFNGDLENDGTTAKGMSAMTQALGGLTVYAVRGNHDNHVSNPSLWESYYDLSYSFIVGNTLFVGLDVPGDVQILKNSAYDDQVGWLDEQLTNAEKAGLTHAFLFWHGPFYCGTSVHCSCSTKTGACSLSTLIEVVNKHKIVTAIFNGHEHVLGWAHLDKSRVPALTNSFEQFWTSPAGGWSYNSYVYPDRFDYFYPSMGNNAGFAVVTVAGAQVTVEFYKVGTAAPVWSKTFVKDGAPVVTVTPGPSVTPVTPTATRTPTKTPTKTATSTPTSTSTPGAGWNCVVVYQDANTLDLHCNKSP